mmetsp:Transcript_67251/g.189460  ORF Transcript_67251/g.189460 Transcript_67251/m.189460 type:complete len:271 (-) Transcript_67251:121-933(-)
MMPAIVERYHIAINGILETPHEALEVFVGNAEVKNSNCREGGQVKAHQLAKVIVSVAERHHVTVGGIPETPLEALEGPVGSAEVEHFDAAERAQTKPRHLPKVLVPVIEGDHVSVRIVGEAPVEALEVLVGAREVEHADVAEGLQVEARHFAEEPLPVEARDDVAVGAVAEPSMEALEVGVGLGEVEHLHPAERGQVEACHLAERVPVVGRDQVAVEAVGEALHEAPEIGVGRPEVQHRDIAEGGQIEAHHLAAVHGDERFEVLLALVGN